MDQDTNVTTDPRQALIEKLQASKNILVTVSANPSVDQLAACLGLTIWLNKQEKHATAVFSGEVPSTLEFLQPADTLEKNTDSLRDFIISLDKTKADKLRYKVEDNVVKIFITPYRTSLTADDLEFSQGDFNVDMVVALGVSEQADLDTAVTSHGRILHDATVATITTGDTNSQLGSISWHDAHASSLCELVVELGNTLGATQLDNQIATALLTGIVAQTERFSNEKTTPQTMSVSAQLMSAGANQQLVASQLSEPVTPAAEPTPEPANETAAEEPSTLEPSEDKPANNDGELAIEHNGDEDEQANVGDDQQPAQDNGASQADQQSSEEAPQISHQMVDQPDYSGTLTANTEPEDQMSEPNPDEAVSPTDGDDQPLLSHDEQDQQDQSANLQPAPADWMPPQTDLHTAAPAVDALPVTGQSYIPQPQETLTQIEYDVDSPHIAETEAVEEAERPDLDFARDEVLKAIGSSPDSSPEPVQALNAQPIDLSPPTDTPIDQPTMSINQPDLHNGAASTAFDPAAFGVVDDEAPLAMPTPIEPAAIDPDLTTPVEQPFTMPLPAALTPPPANPVPPTSVASDPTAPPPVPPPLPFNLPNQQ